MSKAQELKAVKVSEIVEMFKNAESMTVVQYSGLTVAQVTELRKLCRESGVNYCVLKNRLVNRAMEALGLEGGAMLEGPNAFVFSTKDPVSGPKTVNEFITKNKLESLKITGGVFEGKVADQNTMIQLAKMPGRGELLAMLVGCMQSPMASLVAVLDEIAEKKAT